MDRIIEVKVGGNHLRKDNKNAGVKGEGNVTRLRITFDEGWDGYAKTVTFFDAHGSNPVKRIQGIDLIEDITNDTRTYITPIPKEPLAIAGELTFVIDGYLDGKRQRSLSDKLVVKDAPDTDNAGEPVDPTPTQAEQLQVQIDKVLGDIANAEKYAAQAETNANAAIMANTNANIAEQGARQAADNAVAAKNEAVTARNEAVSAKDATLTAKDDVINAHNAVTVLHDVVVTATEEVVTSKDVTVFAKNEAITAGNEAKEYAENAKESAKNAQAQAELALDYRNNANTAKNGAITARDEAKEYAENAEESANKAEVAISHNPIIVDGYWHIWLAQNEEYINTGIKAQAGSEVYVGENPPDSADVWIDPDGEGAQMPEKDQSELINDLSNILREISAFDNFSFIKNNRVTMAPGSIYFFESTGSDYKVQIYDQDGNAHSQIDEARSGIILYPSSGLAKYISIKESPSSLGLTDLLNFKELFGKFIDSTVFRVDTEKPNMYIETVDNHNFHCWEIRGNSQDLPIGTYTAKELIAGITAEVGVKLMYDEDIDTFAVTVGETTVIDKTPIAERARIASELLKAEKTRFTFYNGDNVVYTAKPRSTMPGRGLLLIVQ